MSMLLNYLYLIQKITITQKVNGLIYYAKMIPWLGKKISDQWYQSPRIKKVLSILLLGWTMLCGFFGKAIYLGVMICLPLGIRFGQDASHMVSGGMLYLFFILSCIAGPCILNTTTYPQKKEYVLLHLMHMDAKRYVYAKWFMEFILPSVYVFILWLGILYLSNFPLWYAGVVALCYLCSHFFGEVLHIQYFKHHKKAFAATFSLNVPLCIGLYALAYIPLLIGNDVLSKQLLWIGTMLIYSMLSVILACMYLRKVDFSFIMKKGMLANRDIYNGVLVTKSMTADAKLQDKDYTKAELQAQHFVNKQGYEYLNALFFQRHKRLFYRPMRNRIVGILICFVILDLVVFFLGEEAISSLSSPLSALPSLLFVLYFVSIGERVTRVMFYNCDASLLHYGYYKQPKAILTNFRIRLQKIIQMNFILALLISIGFLSFLICSKNAYEGLDIMVFLISIFSISAFFSIHHLFLYYVLQPYTGELEMKSPIFALVNTGVYLACFMASKIEGSMIFAIVILCATIGYCVLALLLVYRYAPKKFHIR